MGDKTSHRRKHFKPRDPMASALADPLYQQRIVEPRLTKEHRARRKVIFRKLRIESEEND